MEGAVERFWEGQPPVVTARVAPLVFRCSQCGRIFTSAEELRCHFSLDHPLELPALYVGGEPLLRESVIRAPVTETDVELVQCTRCGAQADGGTWQEFPLPAFRQRFAQAVNSTWNIRLIHERAFDNTRTEEEYHVRFRIPDVPALNLLDERFLRTLVLEELRHSDLERYCADLPVDAPAREYGAALGDYALGIILKERTNPPHAPIGFDEFTVKMRSAMEVLKLFNRPIALAVSAAIRFNLNDFQFHGATDATELEHGLRFFRSIIAETSSGEAAVELPLIRSTSFQRPVCPVDRVSHQLLGSCARLAGGGVLPLAELEALRQLTRGMNPVSEQDLLKTHVICAAGYLRIGHATDAIPHLRAVQFDPGLRNWAQRQLNAIPPNGN